MYINHVFEFTMVVESDKFHKLLNRACDKIEDLDNNKYVDQTLASKGILITYHDKQYKKKVHLTVYPNAILDGDAPDKDNISKLIRKLENRIDEYFNSKYRLNDFNLNRITLTTDINVRDRDKVSAYIKVLQRVGKVKGFSPSRDSCDDISFCLEGNSNGVEFAVYNLEKLLRERLEETERGQKQLKTIIGKSEGLLRVEVRLTEPKAIRDYTDESSTSEQIAALAEKSQDIFLDIFQRVVPFGDFYKKDKAVEIIRNTVTDRPIRRRMLRLLELVPEKKSLLLAQKALDYRRIDDVMDMFAAVELVPITISKRHEVKHLRNLYYFL